MNIVSNSCLGTYLQRDFLKQQYENPFCWNIIDFEDFFELIKNYDSINFNNISLRLSTDYIEKTLKVDNDSIIDRNPYVELIIDGKVKIQYIHYHYINKGYKKEGGDIWSNDILNYVKNEYFKRLSRMKESPIFIIGSRIPIDRLTDEQLKILCKYDSKYDVYIFTTNKKQFNFTTSKKIHLLNDENTFNLKIKELTKYFFDYYCKN